MKHFNANGMTMSLNTVDHRLCVLILFLFLYLSTATLAQERAGVTVEGHEIYDAPGQREVPELRKKGYDLDRFPKFKYRINEDALSIRLQIGDPIPEELWEQPWTTIHRSDTIHTVRLSDYRERDLIILDIWAAWCAPCVNSMVKWEELAARYPDNIALLGVNIDFTYTVLPFLKKHRWNSPSVLGLDARILTRSFFKSVMGSRVVWIYKGKLYAITGTDVDGEEYISRILAGEDIDMPQRTEETYGVNLNSAAL